MIRAILEFLLFRHFWWTIFLGVVLVLVCLPSFWQHMRELRAALRPYFCEHRWQEVESDMYRVVKQDGKDSGTVTITTYHCARCGAVRVQPHDRTYAP